MTKDSEMLNNVIPALTINGAAEAIKLYQKAFGAYEVYKVEAPQGGKILHASITIGNTRIFLDDVSPEMAPTPTNSKFYVYVNDVDSTYKQAVQAGLDAMHPVTDMFWGDRTGTLCDKFGIIWTVATHTREVSPEELEEGRKNFCPGE